MGLIRLLPRPGGARSASALSPDAEPEREPEPAPELAPEHETPAEPVAVSEPVPAPDDTVAPDPLETADAVPAEQPAVGLTPSGTLPAGVATSVIALANQKGGVAKTTTTLNLGVALREMGNRVLLVDLDPQGNLTMSQGLNPDVIERSMFDVLVHKIPISEVIERREADLAVASIDLAGAELALSALIGRERSLEKALVEVRNAYDYVLIDTPPSLGLLTINAFVAATGVIVPVQCEYL
ncbi:MAG TPA: AAA family ATPase, partial [Gaiella sp.]